MFDDNIIDLSPGPEDDIPGFPEEKEEGRLKKYLRIAIGIAVVVGLIYISGVSQALFYRRTSPEISQRDVESILDAETIALPVRVYAFVNDGNFGTERTEKETRVMVEEASVVWNQADIDLELESVTFLEVGDSDIGRFLESPSGFVREIDGYNADAINVFLARTLKGVQGVNGLAFSGIRAIAVADLTTVYDFRVLAHEVGHILGLGHTEKDRGQLMHSGTNGFELTADEVLRAREFAGEFVIE